MSNLILANRNSITKIVKNQLGAAAVVSFTAYATGCIIIFDEQSQDSKKELLADLWSAAYTTWKWYMGLGPAPTINTGIPNEIPRCKELEGR